MQDPFNVNHPSCDHTVVITQTVRELLGEDKYSEAIAIGEDRLLDLAGSLSLDKGRVPLDEKATHDSVILRYEIARCYSKLAENFSHKNAINGDIVHRHYSKAARHLETALRLEPDEVFSLHLLGKVYMKMGEDDKALAIADRLTQINPKEAGPASIIMAQVHMRKGHYAECIEAAEKSIEIAKQENDEYTLSMGLTFKGKSHLALGEYAKALEVSAHFLELAERMPIGRDRNRNTCIGLDIRAQVELAQGQYEAALDTANQISKVAEDTEDQSMRRHNLRIASGLKTQATRKKAMPVNEVEPASHLGF